MLQNDLGINLNDLGELAKSNPKYAELFGQLAGIDIQIKEFARDTIETYGDPELYYIKTELLNYCYNIYLYNKERKATIGFSWLFSDFLTKCQTKQIEKETQLVILKMLETYGMKNLKEDKINWVTI